MKKQHKNRPPSKSEKKKIDGKHYNGACGPRATPVGTLLVGWEEWRLGCTLVWRVVAEGYQNSPKQPANSPSFLGACGLLAAPYGAIFCGFKDWWLGFS